MLLRAGLAFLLVVMLGALARPALAEGGLPRLRGDITARQDVLTLGDLVENVPPAVAGKPLFRAPALGATGTIQSRRIAERRPRSASPPSKRRPDAGRRPARGPPGRRPRDRGGAEARPGDGYGLDTNMVTIRLDGEAPTMLAPLDLAGQASALDLIYDSRSHRVSALVSLGERQASLRVSGIVVEMRDVAVLARGLNRGEPVREGDVVLERRPKDNLGTGAQASATAGLGEVAQRALPAGSILREGDTARRTS